MAGRAAWLTLDQPGSGATSGQACPWPHTRNRVSQKFRERNRRRCGTTTFEKRGAMLPRRYRSFAPDLASVISTAAAVREQHGKDVTYHAGHPPDAVAFARTTEEVAEIVRICAAARGAGDRLRHRHVARGPHRGAPGRHLDRSRRAWTRSSRSTPPISTARVQAGVTRNAAERPPARHRPVLSDRPGRGRLDRRHGGDAGERHQRGALRHHARERAGADRGHRRRPDREDRRAGAEVGGGLRPHAALRRLRGHARHHHRGAASPLRHPGGDLGGRLLVRRRSAARSTR